MRNAFLAAAFGLLIATSVGCIIPGYSADPVRRTEELTYTSENLHRRWTNGAALDVGSAEPHDARPHARRHYVVRSGWSLVMVKLGKLG